MDEFIVQLLAKLDTNQVIKDYNTLKQQLEKQINIKVSFDASNANNISKLAEQLQTALSKASNGKLNLDTSQITSALEQTVRNAQQTRQKIDNAINQGFSKSENAIKSFKDSLTNAGKSSTEIDSIIDKVKSLNVQIDSLRFSESTNGFMNIDVSGLDQFDNKVKITQSLVQDLKTMQWNVSNATTSVISTKELDKINNAFADYTQKLEQFKSTNNNILFGLSAPLSDFENKLSGLHNGSVTIDELKNSFSMLNAEASKITSNLSGQLSKTDAAIRNIAKGSETISGLKAEFNGLSNTPKEITSELNKLSTSLNNIKKIEAQEGRTANWSQVYREWEQAVDSLKAKLTALKKEQANSATTQVFNTSDLDKQGKIYIQKVSNTIEKTKSEIESKLRNAGYTDIEVRGVEDANGKIKSLTATVTDAAGAFKQLAFERAKIQNKGNAQSGFIQSDDVKVVGNIATAIDKVETNLLSLKAKWEEQGVLVGEFRSKVEQLETSISTVGSKSELNGLKAQIESLKNEASTITQANKIQLSIETGGYDSKVESLIVKTQQWTDVNGNARISTTALSTALNNLGDASKALSNNNTVENQKALIAAEKELDTQIKIVTNSVRSMNSEYMKTSAVDTLRNKVQQFYDLNGKSHFKWGSDLKRIMSELGQGMEVPIVRGKQLEQEFIQIQNAARQAGKLGKTWFQTLKEGMSSFSYWTSSTFIVMKIIQSIKGGISSVKALDTALVDLKKTTTMTSSELEQFYYDSNKVAKQMGVATEEIIDQASAFSRLGWSSADAATKMAKLSSQFASISPGMSVDEATTNLTSIIKAYDIEVDDILDGVLSKINQIGNTFGTSNAEIAEGLRLSSAAMASLGGTFEENIALFTAGQEILQDASQMGNAIRSITMRIKGYDEETQEFSKDVVEATGKVADLTKVASNNNMGISMFTDASQTHYKSLVEYLGEISDIWDEIDEKSQVDLLQNLFGKNRAQAGAAIINNFDTVRESLEAMENSAGSADREMSVIMDKPNCPYVQKCA